MSDKKFGSSKKEIIEDNMYQKQRGASQCKTPRHNVHHAIIQQWLRMVKPIMVDIITNVGTVVVNLSKISNGQEYQNILNQLKR